MTAHRLLVHITRDITELFPTAEWGDDEERILKTLIDMSTDDVLDGASWSLERREEAPEVPKRGRAWRSTVPGVKPWK